MCGIAAIINPRSEDKPLMSSMLNEIIHRGDTSPIHKDFTNCSLGIVRLKIVDIEKGQQPFFNEDKSIAVVFNGEIYNYKELKSDLSTKHIFHTDCDSEILPHLFEEYGINFLYKLQGMFSFVLYDFKNNDFFAVRDFFGVKPLFYTKVNDTVYLASELKAFNSVNTKEYFELLPGHYMTKKGKVKYYNIPKCSYHIEPESKIRDSVQNLMEEAVIKRVKTDLPIAVFMGGGIDSAIVNLLANKYHSDVTSIIIGMEDSEDVYYGLKLCKDYQLKHIFVPITESKIIDSIPDVIQSIETFEPNLVRGSVISDLLAKTAKEYGFKVVLCGEGSDEIFGGYGDFLHVEQNHEFQELLLKYLKDLYRTQLHRVDRTGMRYGVEVREPFLDRDLVEYTLNIPPDLKVSNLSNGEKTTKYILREAFKELLPEYIYTRQKQTMMDGAGIGEVNKNKGLLFRNAENVISDSKYIRIKEEYSDYSLISKEEVLNFCHYIKHYQKAFFNKSRVNNAQNEITRIKETQFA